MLNILRKCYLLFISISTHPSLFVTAAKSGKDTFSIIFTGANTYNKFLLRNPELAIEQTIENDVELKNKLNNKLNMKRDNLFKSLVILIHQLVVKDFDPNGCDIFDYDNIITEKNVNHYALLNNIDLNIFDEIIDYDCAKRFAIKYIVETKELLFNAKLHKFFEQIDRDRKEYVYTYLSNHIEQTCGGNLIFNEFYIFDIRKVHKSKKVIKDILKKRRSVSKILIYHVDVLAGNVYEHIYDCFSEGCYDLKRVFLKMTEPENEDIMEKNNNKQAISLTHQIKERSTFYKDKIEIKHYKHSILEDNETLLKHITRRIHDMFGQEFGDTAVSLINYNFVQIYLSIWKTLDELVTKQFDYLAYNSNKNEYILKQHELKEMLNNINLKHDNTEIIKAIEIHQFINQKCLSFPSNAKVCKDIKSDDQSKTKMSSPIDYHLANLKFETNIISIIQRPHKMIF